VSHLLVTGLRVTFGGIVAVDDASLDVARGEIVALIGPNGAGKTTLFNAISGQLEPDRGTVRLEQTNLLGLATFRRARLGVGRTFQRVEVFGELSVRDNLLVAARARRRRPSLWRDLVERTAPTDAELSEVDEVMERVGIAERADDAVCTLSLGACRLVELGRALVARPSLLLADEPTSGLDTEEAARLSEVLLSARRERGLAVLVVEHDLATVESVSDRVVVIHLGRVIAAGDFATVMADPVVREAYLGQVVT
jgi:branched-chain amino acid transport system ATP-binding protein